LGDATDPGRRANLKIDPWAKHLLFSDFEINLPDA
jgi:hypothetical protein